jgi:negative regulator of flagellin synthesis FlgM
MVSTTALAPGAPPVDAQRTAQIRKALENGTYPVLPTKISDAMIAAGMVLRIGK